MYGIAKVKSGIRWRDNEEIVAIITYKNAGGGLCSVQKAKFSVGGRGTIPSFSQKF